MKQIVCEFSDHDLAEQAAHRCASRVILFWKRALKQKNIRRKRLRSLWPVSSWVFLPTSPGRVRHFAF